MQKILELGRVVEEFFCGGAYTVDAFTRHREIRSDIVQELPFALVLKTVEPQMDKSCLGIGRRPCRIDFRYALLGSAPLVPLTIRPSFCVRRFGLLPLGKKIIDPFGGVG
jgi:hypothetical protein